MFVTYKTVSKAGMDPDLFTEWLVSHHIFKSLPSGHAHELLVDKFSAHKSTPEEQETLNDSLSKLLFFSEWVTNFCSWLTY